ncbi:MAG: hypothetical protein KDA05_01740, partial [Phycisphaerales bacterium]|nr:hypothetical protein [Phycisphaerales bacterium]
MLQDRSRWPEPLRQAERAGLAIPSPMVNTDRASNRLLVSAPSLLMPVAVNLIGTLDQAPRGEAVEVSVFRLTRGDAASAAPALRSALEADRRPGTPAPVVNADAASNTLVIAASAEQMPKVRELIAGVDQAVEPAGIGVRTVFLRFARAESVAPIVESVLTRQDDAQQQIRRNAWWFDPSMLESEPDIRVAAEPRLNAVVVSAPAAVLELAEQLVRELDVSPQGPDPSRRMVRVIPIASADASTLAESISAMFGDDLVGEAPPVIRVDASSNALIVRASGEQMQRIESLAREIDAASFSTSRQMRMVPVDRSRADAAAMAQTIRQILEQRSGVRVEVISVDELMQRGQPGGEDPDDNKPGGTKGRSRERADPAEPGEPGGALAADPLATPDPTRGATASVLSAMMGHFAPPSSGLSTSPSAGPSAGALAAELWGFTATERAPKRATPMPVAPPTPGTADLAANLWTGAAAATPAQPTEPESRPPTPPPTQPVPGPAPESASSNSDAGSITIAVDPRTNSLLVIGSPRLTDQVAALASDLASQIPPEPTTVRVIALPASADPQSINQIIQQTVRQVGRADTRNPGGFTGPVASTPDPAGGAIIVWANDTDFVVLGDLIAAVASPAAADTLSVKIYPLRTLTAQAAARAVNDLLGTNPRGRQAQRMLSLALAEEPDLARTFDPSRVRVTPNPGGTALIVTGPSDVLPLLDRFVALIDQTPVADRASIRQYALANARAGDLLRTLQPLLRAQARQDDSSLPEPALVADDRTNSLFVTAADVQHEQIELLIAAADAETSEPDLELAIITLQQALPSTVQRIVEQVIIGRDPARRDRVQISAQDNSALFVVRAPAEDIEQIRAIVAEVDTAETTGLPVRTVRLERADAQNVARALQQFFQARAQAGARPGQRSENRVAITGDRQSGVLVIAASDEDFAQVQAMVADFDAPAEHREMVYRIIRLENALASEIESTINEIQWSTYEERVWGNRNNDQMQDRLYLTVNDRLNAVVAVGQGEMIDTV